MRRPEVIHELCLVGANGTGANVLDIKRVLLGVTLDGMTEGLAWYALVATILIEHLNLA